MKIKNSGFADCWRVFTPVRSKNKLSKGKQTIQKTKMNESLMNGKLVILSI